MSQDLLSIPRNAIAEAMVWCIEHADSGEEIVECLAESLSILEVSKERPDGELSCPTKSYDQYSPVLSLLDPNS